MYWRKYFKAESIAKGQRLYSEGKVSDLRREDDILTWTAEVRDSKVYRAALKLDAREYVAGGGCSCLKGSGGSGCEHIAALCLAVEARLDGTDPEPPAPRPQKSPRAGAERDRKVTSPFTRLANSGEYHYFDLNFITMSVPFTSSLCRAGKKIMKEGGVSPDHPPCFEFPREYAPDRGGDEAEGAVDATVREDDRSYGVSLRFDKSGVRMFQCGCGACYSERREENRVYKEGNICRHGLAVLFWLEDYILRENPGDATDLEAMRLMGETGDIRGISSVGPKDGHRVLRLEPRLETDGRTIAARFRVGTDKLHVLKDLPGFVRRFGNGEKESFGKDTVIDYKACDLDESSERFFRFIKDTIASEWCRDMDRRSVYGPAMGISGMDIQDRILLTGERLDTFYDLVGDRKLHVTDVGLRAQIMRQGGLSGERGQAAADFTVEKRMDGKGQFEGVTVYCKLPLFLEGVEACYRVTWDRRLERIPKDSLRGILPLCREADDLGMIQFHVGRWHLAWLYRDLLPVLREFGPVTGADDGEISGYVPDPAFRFYLDTEDMALSCRTVVVYGEKEADIADLLLRDGESRAFPMWRDESREREALDLVSRYFPEYDGEQGQFVCREEDAIFLVLSSGVSDLMELGEVNCTEQFLRLRIRPAAGFTVGVTMGSGLLDLEITSEGLSPEELLRVLDAYRLKKRYIRLKNGDFLRTDDGEETAGALAELLEVLQVTPGEFVKGKMSVPAYRALYLDKMLEEHGDIYFLRDSHYRQLTERIKTARGADFKVPESLAPVLRGYQEEGYKWLRTLEAYNFGGILADDMGLGKTLQMIAVFLAWNEEGINLPSLVVCPASLVYNWGEELERFAPELRVALVAGTRTERESVLEDYDQYDVLVTSYELLKRDIDIYGDCNFYGQVLDEAQSIKNHTTAAARTVKLIHSQHRFALTGTPIENRLSELWSIFDFLLPGFLYRHETFRKEIETPIMRRGDRNASERLRRMVSPFILRRLKKDVLRDLPGKIEEVVRVKADQKQQLLCDAQAAHIRDMLSSRDEDEFRKERIKFLAELTRLRRVCCDPSLVYENYDGGSAKREACLELIEQAMEGGHRMLIFSQFTTMLALLEEDLREFGIAYYKLIGATPKEERVELVRAFNEGEVPVFLISLKAGGTGLNLTGADVVIHYDPWWNLAAEDQATDRAHRIGQTRVVTEYKLILKGSVEEKILQLQEEKRGLAEEILSGQESGGLGSLSREELLELLGV